MPLVTGIYDIKAFMTEMTNASVLRGWDGTQGVQLCEALRHAHAHGGPRELEYLDLKTAKSWAMRSSRPWSGCSRRADWPTVYSLQSC